MFIQSTHNKIYTLQSLYLQNLYLHSLYWESVPQIITFSVDILQKITERFREILES